MANHTSTSTCIKQNYASTKVYAHVSLKKNPTNHGMTHDEQR